MKSYTLKKFKTNHLFPRTGFLTGMGSVLNISGNYFDFNYSKDEHKADAAAIASDWGMIGQDLQSVLDSELRQKNGLKKSGQEKNK